MKRFFAVALLLATLIACGKKEEAPPEAPAVPTPAVVPETPPTRQIAPEPAQPAAIPANEAKTLPAEEKGTPADNIHTVVKGDTLYDIARKHGLDYRDLARWNDIKNPRRIRIGQKLRLTAPEQ
jgi:LysM repeat protein